MFERTKLDQDNVLLSLEITGHASQSYDNVVDEYRKFFDATYISKEQIRELSPKQAERAQQMLMGEVIAAPSLPKMWKSAAFCELFDQTALRLRNSGNSKVRTYLCLVVIAQLEVTTNEDGETPDMLF